MNEISYLKAEQHSLIISRLEGLMIRSRAKLIKELDQAHSSFFPKRTSAEGLNSLTSLMMDGTLVTETEKIISACKTFWHNLLTAEAIDYDFTRPDGGGDFGL